MGSRIGLLVTESIRNALVYGRSILQVSANINENISEQVPDLLENTIYFCICLFVCMLYYLFEYILHDLLMKTNCSSHLCNLS